MAEHDQKDLPRGTGRFAAPLRRAVLDVAVFVLIAILNPFGIADWSEMRSQDFWQRVNADNYPSTAFSLSEVLHRAKPQPPAGRAAITVVYFDDASVKRQYGAEGLTSFALLDLIDDIDLTPTKPPAAIFVDMVLDDAGPERLDTEKLLGDALGSDKNQAIDAGQCARREPQVSPFRCLVIRAAQLTNYKAWHGDRMCQEGTLAKLACIRREGGLPLIFADVSTQLQKDRRFDDRPQSAASVALGTVAALSPATIDVNAYPLVTPNRAADRQDQPFQLYPAAALYDVWCMDHACKERPTGTDRSGRLTWSKDFEKALEVAWGIGTTITDDLADPTHLLVYRPVEGVEAKALIEGCTAAQPGRINDLKHLAKMALSGLWNEKPSCLYPRAVPSDIFQSASMSRGNADALLRGKLVIVGAQFRASTDYVAAAPFGEVPGIYLHAMALDNLIESGPRYQSKPARVVGHFATNDLLNVVVLFVVSYILAKALIDIKVIEDEEQRGARLPWSRLRRFGIILGAAVFTLAFWMVILALTRLPSIGVRIIPDNINAAAAMLFAVLGLLDLSFEAMKPLLEEAWTRARLGFGSMLHGAEPAEPVADEAHGEPAEAEPK